MFRKSGFFLFQRKILRYVSVGLLYVFNGLILGCSSDSITDPLSPQSNADSGSESSLQSPNAPAQSDRETGGTTPVNDTTAVSDSGSSTAPGTGWVSPDTPVSNSDSVLVPGVSGGGSPGTSISDSVTVSPPTITDDMPVVALYGVIAPEYGVEVFEYKIIGEIRAMDTDLPIAGIEVRVRYQENNYAIDTLTNSEGRFEISAFDARVSRNFTVEIRDVDGEANGRFTDMVTTILAESGKDNIVDVRLDRLMVEHPPASGTPAIPEVTPLYGVPVTEFETRDNQSEP